MRAISNGELVEIKYLFYLIILPNSHTFQLETISDVQQWFQLFKPA